MTTPQLIAVALCFAAVLVPFELDRRAFYRRQRRELAADCARRERLFSTDPDAVTLRVTP